MPLKKIYTLVSGNCQSQAHLSWSCTYSCLGDSPGQKVLQLFLFIFFVTRCHCTHKCVPGTPGNLGTDGLGTWQEATSDLRTAVWLSLLSSGLAFISVFISFWSRSRVNFHSKLCSRFYLRNHFIFFPINIGSSLIRHCGICQLQIDKQRTCHLSCCRSAAPTYAPHGPTRLSIKDYLPVCRQGVKPKLQLVLTILTEQCNAAAS